MDFPKIGIVIPVFNRVNYTIQCLESLKDVIYSNFEIIIIDDGSIDGTSKIIRKNFPNVILLQGDGNLWWSKATNVGIKKAITDSCQFVLFLNNDDVVDKCILQNLMICARDNPGAIIGCKVLDFDQPNKLIFAGGDCDWEKKGLFRYGDGEVDIGQYNTRKEIKWIPGAGTFVNVELFKKIGFLNDRYFPQNRADIDFTLRAHEAGYKIIFEPQAVLFKRNKVTDPSAEKKHGILEKIIRPLFSKRSYMNLKVEAIFIYKHCPGKYMVRRFFSIYYLYYKGFFRLDTVMSYLGIKGR